jgi:hypothetical protein
MRTGRETLVVRSIVVGGGVRSADVGNLGVLTRGEGVCGTPFQSKVHAPNAGGAVGVRECLFFSGTEKKNVQ